MRLRFSIGASWQAILFGAALINIICVVTACSAGSEEQGRIKVSASDVVGVYTSGAERLEIEPNGTYVQDFVSNFTQLHRTGNWIISNHLWDGSEVVLIDAAVTSPSTPNDRSPSLGSGNLRLHVHKRAGKIALARNEVADWYFERVQ